jgi:ubiquinone/menaquinone biosynthesis C-methylase UbiE
MPGSESFDKNVSQYEQWFIDHPHAYVSELHAVRELLPEGNGLEIGVGTGRFAAPLGITNGIEPSLAMASLAKRKGIEVVTGKAENMPYYDGNFDFALMVTTVCFLDDMDLAFREAYRVIKPGGSFIIGFVDRESPLGREYQQRKDKSVFYKDATFYSVTEVVSHLEQAGFRDFSFCQTLFKSLDDMEEVEPVKDGHGQGSFVVVCGKK